MCDWVYDLVATGDQMKVCCSLPHIAQHLDVTGDLLFGASDSMALEIIYEKLVAPSTAAS
jgi:hypothetical protein